MALLSDGTVSTIEDLAAYESAILEVANTERVDLTVKLKLAEEELAITLAALLAGREGEALANVVVTEPLHKWHTFQALALVYRDAFHQELNDRHLAKWREYQRLAQWAQDALYQRGLGMVRDPVARAAAPQLSSAIAGGLADRAYYVRVTWQNAAGAEGAPGEPAIMSLQGGSVLAVTPVNAPANAVGWNLYVGTTAGEERRQNSGSVAVGQTWTEPASGLVQGAAPGDGQAPDYYLQPVRLLQRG